MLPSSIAGLLNPLLPLDDSTFGALVRLTGGAQNTKYVRKTDLRDNFGDILLGKLENEGERKWVADRYRIAIDGHAKRVRCGRVASPERD